VPLTFADTVEVGRECSRSETKDNR